MGATVLWNAPARQPNPDPSPGLEMGDELIARSYTLHEVELRAGGLGPHQLWAGTFPILPEYASAGMRLGCAKTGRGRTVAVTEPNVSEFLLAMRYEFWLQIVATGNASSFKPLTKTMNLMKKSLFGLLAAAAALPASAAVVNYSWTGAAGYVVSGQMDIGAATGAITEADVVSVTMTIVNPSTATIFSGAGSNLSISFNTAALGSGVSGGFSIDGDDFGNTGSVWSLAGTAGGGWLMFDQFSAAADTDIDGAQNLTLTAVPEPEMLAAVAGMGLVAFGLARRKFLKA